jgi:hypothetical protein
MYIVSKVYGSTPKRNTGETQLAIKVEPTIGMPSVKDRIPQCIPTSKTATNHNHMVKIATVSSNLFILAVTLFLRGPLRKSNKVVCQLLTCLIVSLIADEPPVKLRDFVTDWYWYCCLAIIISNYVDDGPQVVELQAWSRKEDE